MSVDIKKTILLVEDEVLIAMSKQQELKKYNYNVIHTDTGEKALALIKDRDDIDLILMDIDLGKGIDGTEAAELILKDHDIPIIFVSSHTETEVVEKTEKITSYGYVVKSSSITVLDASIKMAFKLFNSHKSIEEGKILLQKTIDGVTEPILMINKDYKVLASNMAVKKFYDADKEYCYQVSHNRDEPCDNADHPCMLRGVIETKKPVKSIHRHINMNGEERFVELTVTPVFNDELDVTSIIEATNDITDRLKLEEIQNEYTSNLDSLVNNRKESIWSIDKDYNYVIFNNFFKEAYYAVYKIELQKGMNSLNILPSNEIDFWKSKYDEALSGNAVLFEHTSHYGAELRFYEVSLNPIITNNEITGITVLSIDITEQNKIKKALIRNEIRFHELFQNMSSGVAVYNAVDKGNDFVFIDFNKAAEQIDKLVKSDIIGKRVSEVFPGVEKLEVFSVFKRVWETGVSEYCPVFHYEDGRIGGWRENFIYKLPSGELVAIYDDITERKKAEEALKINESFLSTLILTIPDFVIHTDLNGDIVLANNAIAKKFPTMTSEYLIGKNMMSFIAEKDQHRAIENTQLMFEQSLGVQEYQLILNDDNFYIFAVNGEVVRDSDLKPTGMVYLLRDITKSKKEEGLVKQQLLEKELILKETHHRIKNNFATIGSLLSLQANSLTNPEAISALQDAIGRVNSMQVLYEKMLLTDNYQTTSVKAYLNDIIVEIESLLSNKNITIKKLLDDFHLAPKQLVPVGIIVNELLTNVMKYAFTEKESGLIEVTLKDNRGKITLTIQDNGNGLPDGFDIDNQKGFGLMLVKMLVQQLDGNFTLENFNGTRSVVQFSI